MTERFKLITEVHLVLIRDGKIFLSRRSNTGYNDGNYGVIAGHVDGSESVVHALVREAKEEGGIAIDSKDVSLVHVMHRKSDDERISWFFSVSQWKGELHNAEQDKCDDLSWFSFRDLPKNTIPYIRTAISHILNKNVFSLYGWD